MLGFIFDGHASADYGIYIEDPGIDASPIPPARNRDEVIPGYDGAWDYGTDFGPLPIELTCFMAGIPNQTIQANILAYGVFLNPKLGPKPLILPDRSGYYLARYSGLGNFQPRFNWVRFKLTFLCNTPTLFP